MSRQECNVCGFHIGLPASPKIKYCFIQCHCCGHITFSGKRVVQTTLNVHS